MEGHDGVGRRRPSTRSRRRSPAVYRRRRIVTGLAVAALVAVPLRCAGSDDGGSGEPQASAAEDGGSSGAQGVVGGAGGAPPAAAPACDVDLAALTVRERLALLLMVGIDGGAEDGLAVLRDDDRPGGVFVRPGEALWDSGAVADWDGDGRPLLVGVDDEGGRVQPLEGVLDELPSAQAMADLAPDEVEQLATARGQSLVELGVNLVLGPVADVGGGAGIGDRSFADEPEAVTTYAGAYATGLRNAGVLPVLKHFPGHGRAGADTHLAPSTTPALDDLRPVDLRPYETLLGPEPTGVMVGHLDVPDLTPGGVPASLSPDAIGLLRGAYDFDGLVVTDDLVGMRAVSDRFEVPDAAERALVAGADVVLLAQPTDVGAVLDRLESAVAEGRLTERRVEAALGRVARAGCRVPAE